MIINTANLDALRVGFKTSFQKGLGQAESQYQRIATTVPASTKEQKYGWIGKIPNVREWIGPRAVQNLQEHDYAIKEKPWELTIGVDRDDIETDNLGIYAPMFEEMGMSVGAHPNMLSFGLLKDGFTAECYDGQPFFDADHPVLDENGEPQSVSNTGGGANAPWFLLSTRRALKPIIFQERKKFEFVPMDDPKNEHVFMNKEFRYGSDARNNVGFGFWQMAYGSQQTLEKDAYKAGFAALEGMKGDYGRPLGIVPDTLVVGPSNREAGLEILNAERDAMGATNVWRGTTELLVIPWLA